MKKLLIIAIAGLLFASCEKDEKEKTESDIIVKEYGEDYVLDFHDRRGMKINGTTRNLGVNIDINDDGVDDVMVCLTQYSGGEYIDYIPVSSFATVGGLREYYLHYGDAICDTTNWESETTLWFGSRPVSDEYIAVKFVTDTSVNYGWILPIIEPHYLYDLDDHCTVSIVKSGYCKTNGKTIFAGQEE